MLWVWVEHREARPLVSIKLRLALMLRQFSVNPRKGITIILLIEASEALEE
jgi:hypothetical protein